MREKGNECPLNKEPTDDRIDITDALTDEDRIKIANLLKQERQGGDSDSTISLEDLEKDIN